MAEAIFNGKFQKPTEAFAVQHLDPTELNRLTSDVFLWFAVAVVAGLAVHFVLQSLPDLLRREKSQ
ncbi:MAG: hypothetical protein FJX37_03225 [Alphaproteobacteria bacterium]|nr:hypothetical protein [Alphaproteobacteria bacterium]MBM3951540.1 hypothetical protein [Rhodospirillales bacterium]